MMSTAHAAVSTELSSTELTTADGYRLRVATAGLAEQKPCLLLVMPFGMHVEMAFPFLEFMKDAFCVVTWEARLILDESRNEEPANALSVDQHVRDLETVVAHFDVQKASVVGYCSGAGVALLANRAFPTLIDRLVLAHGEYTLLGERECTTQFAMDIDSILSMSAQSEAFAKKVYEKVKDDRVSTQDDVPVGVDMPYSDFLFFRRFAINYTYYKGEDYAALAKDVTVPTLLVTGEKDKQANAASTHFIGRHVAGSKVIVDPDADHYGLLRPRSRTMVHTRAFLDEHHG